MIRDADGAASSEPKLPSALLPQSHSSLTLWLWRHSNTLVPAAALAVGLVVARFVPTGYGVALSLGLVLVYRLGLEVGRFDPGQRSRSLVEHQAPVAGVVSPGGKIHGYPDDGPGGPLSPT